MGINKNKKVSKKPLNNLSKNDIVQGILKGDLDKFLRRVYKNYHYQLTYSVTLRNWRKDGLKLVRALKKTTTPPGIVNSLCNIHKVMVKYYDLDLTWEDFKITLRVEDVLSDTIWKYCTERYREEIIVKKKAPKLPTKAEAAYEVKRRGFVELIDFDSYDKEMAHIVTNNNLGLPRLYYPKNFKWGRWETKDPEDMKNHGVELAHKFYGVAGYTRILTKMDR